MAGSRAPSLSETPLSPAALQVPALARTPAREIRHLWRVEKTSVPFVCDLELIAPTRVPNSAKESAPVIGSAQVAVTGHLVAAASRRDPLAGIGSPDGPRCPHLSGRG